MHFTINEHIVTKKTNLYNHRTPNLHVSPGCYLLVERVIGPKLNKELWTQD